MAKSQDRVLVYTFEDGLKIWFAFDYLAALPVVANEPSLAIIDGDEMDINLASQIRFEYRKPFFCVAGEANQIHSLLLSKRSFGQILVGLLKCSVLIAIKRNELGYFLRGIQRNHQIHYILQSIPEVLQSKLQGQFSDGMPRV